MIHATDLKKYYILSRTSSRTKELKMRTSLISALVPKISSGSSSSVLRNVLPSITFGSSD